jgi:hypothetical protein
LSNVIYDIEEDAGVSIEEELIMESEEVKGSFFCNEK